MRNLSLGRQMRVATVAAGLVALTACDGCNTVDTASCEIDSDCASTEQCENGRCVPRRVAACTEDLDCGNGRECINGVCQVRIVRTDGGLQTVDAGSSSSSSGNPGGGVLFLNPSDQLEFGDPLLNQDIIRTSILRNDGSGPLNVTAVTLTPGTSSEYGVATSSTLPVAIAVGEEMRISVTYHLVDAEVDVGSVTIRSDASSCTFNCPDPTNVRLPLFAEFKGDKQLAVAPTTHDFGFIDVGSQSPDFSINASNAGTRSRILTVQSVTLTGAGAAHFGVQTAGLTLPALLSPQQVVPIPVFYKPLAQGTHQAELEITADSDNPDLRLLKVTLNGRSVPTVDLSADSINFGTVQIGQELTRSTTIHNNSNVSVTIQAGAFANGQGTQGFYLPSPAPFPLTIPMGSTATVEVIFRPTGTAGARSDALNFAHNLSATPVTAALTGNAEPPPPPPGGPGLDAVMTYTRGGTEQEGCGNWTGIDNYQNMDLIMEAGGGTCEKPTVVGGQCPSDNMCTCSFGAQGGATWRASGGTAPEPYQVESISHNQAGGDGTFMVKTRYWDDCSDYYRSGFAAFAQGICGYGGTPPLRYYCFPRDKFPSIYVACGVSGEPYNGYCISETDCLYLAQTLDGECGGHAGSTAKVVVTIKNPQGQVVEARGFCRPYTQSSQAVKNDVVTMVRNQGYFTFGAVAPGVTTLVNASDNCP
ncbi:MAG: choice-of-anchor D domain-containing protein [Deltaproteobacteria bacterium]|nr:choice-of-anchor D domain-containing protein [Deltaproteobacteria bacterium]